ncbi:hypothetical protein HF285_10695 [Acidithiobacillus ferrooxidans F221]|uniref:hypothetical protein n=1 Tax=Acidithiobacillus ferrooxidans TaxID=920 RepID=UPI001C066A5F|nr:hypothetical protein [Acidithiobacillus ferrooxidans]MBU2808708.1 hypothetical protein [Acidithiobacillus ferrooxidans F221]
MSALDAFDGQHIQAVAILWILLGGLVGVLAGAVSGALICGKKLGDNKLAAMMGGMYGAMPVIPGLVLGTIILVLI